MNNIQVLYALQANLQQGKHQFQLLTCVYRFFEHSLINHCFFCS